MAHQYPEFPPAPPGKLGWPWIAETDSKSFIKHKECPRISVVTPSFNQARFIEETIRSVLLQNYPNLEYLVIDGGSTDGSLAIIEKYAPWLTYWVSEKDEGQAHALNKGFARATGSILGWLNSDDVYYPGALAAVGQAVSEAPSYVAYAGVCDRVDAAGTLLSTVVPRNLSNAGIADWFSDGFLYQPACFFRRETYEAVGGINNLFHNALDVDLWLRLVGRGEFRVLDSRLAHAKIHGEMKTLKNVALRDAETVALAILHGHRGAAINRIRAFANHYMDVDASELVLLRALFKQLRSRLRALFDVNRRRA